MRHGKTLRKLGRTASHRRALLRHLVTALFAAEKGRIRTTLEKAKETRPLAEKMITLGKRDDLHARRLALAYVSDPKVVRKLFSDIAPRYATRPGGYTRILRLGYRKGDSAEMAMLELVEAGNAASGQAAAGGDKAAEAKTGAKAEKANKPAKPRPAPAATGEKK